MSITLFEGSLERLLGSAEGPVGRAVDNEGQLIFARARVQAANIIKGVPDEDLLDYALEEHPLQAVISVNLSSRRGAYLTRKAGEPGQGWLGRALRNEA